MSGAFKDISAGLRPALFLKSIGFTFDDLDLRINALHKAGIIENAADIKNSIVEQLVDVLDELWSPIVAFEIGKYSEGRIITDPAAAYFDFFIGEGKKWKIDALDIYDKHFYQARVIRNLANNSYEFICNFLDILSRDFKNLEAYLGSDATLSAIDLGASDTHNLGKFSIILAFSNGKGLIFKPKSSANDEFLFEYFSLLELSDEIQILLPAVIHGGDNYFWSEYIENKKYSASDDLEKFYRNAGAVLAVMDSLNFSDGHHENFISAPGHKLCLIDSETILINLSYFDGKLDSFYDLSFTGMIEDKQCDKSYISALQANEDFFSYPVSPSVMNDLTTDIRIVYNTVKRNIYAKSSPIEQGHNIQNFAKHVKSGALDAYWKITSVPYIEIRNLLLKYADRLQLRQIKRHTLYYQWLLHRMAHPMNGDEAKFIDENMRNYQDEIVQCELVSLRNGDIPIFYHKPFDRGLYGSGGKIVVEDYFAKPAEEWFQKKVGDLSCECFLAERMQQIDRMLLGGRKGTV